MTRSAHALRALVAVVAVSAAGALAAEGAVRIRQWLRVGRMGIQNDTFTIDPETGLRTPIPNLVRGGIAINSLGFRGPELAVPKPPDTVRLGFLGGSTTFCAEVSSNEATWPHLVWRSLTERFPAVRFDYVNAGVSGFDLAAIVRQFQARVQRLAPDVVVIYEATNDLAHDSRRLAAEQQLDVDGFEPGSWLARQSLLWFLIEKNLVIRRLQASLPSQSGKLSFEPQRLSRGFAQRLRDIVRAAQAVAPVVAVATFSPRLRRNQSVAEQTEAAVTDVPYMPYMTLEGLLAGYEEYNRVIRSVAAETGAVLIDGEERIPADDLHYNDSVHFRDPGSQVMAARVTEALVATPAFRDLVTRVVPHAAARESFADERTGQDEHLVVSGHAE
jgi:lysophospholipase L1-like esterase